MPRLRAKIDARKDPLGYLESYLLPKALRKLDRCLSFNVPADHPQYVRSFTIKRAAAATVGNMYVALKTLGIQNRNSDVLAQILARIKDRENKRLLDVTPKPETLYDLAVRQNAPPVPAIAGSGEGDEGEPVD